MAPGHPNHEEWRPICACQARTWALDTLHASSIAASATGWATGGITTFTGVKAATDAATRGAGTAATLCTALGACEHDKWHSVAPPGSTDFKQLAQTAASKD